MTDSELIIKLKEVFNRVFKDDSITINENTSASDIEQWDSLTHPILIDEVENEFKVKFKLKELIRMQNVGDLIKIIKEKFWVLLYMNFFNKDFIFLI